MKVSIKNEEVASKPWDFLNEKGEKLTGTSRTQKAVVDCASYRKPIRIKLGDRPSYAPGDYEIDFESSVKFTDLGDLVAEKNLVLIPLKKGA